MAITKPQLPPKAGYVEVEVNGQRRYRSVKNGCLLGEEPPTEMEQLQKENQLLKQQVEALSDQNEFQEELIVELANIVYA